MGAGRAQLVLGAAGAGKTTYCRRVKEYGLVQRRSFILINLDPAAEDQDEFAYDIGA